MITCNATTCSAQRQMRPEGSVTDVLVLLSGEPVSIIYRCPTCNRTRTVLVELTVRDDTGTAIEHGLEEVGR